MITFVGNMLMILGIMVMAFYCVWSIREDILSVVVDLKSRAKRKMWLQLSSIATVGGSALSVIGSHWVNVRENSPFIYLIVALHITLVLFLVTDSKKKINGVPKLNEDSDELQYSLMSRIVGSRYVFIIVILTLLSLGLIQIL